MMNSHMSLLLRVLVSVVLLLPGKSQGARILALFPIYANSHHMVLQPIMRTLAEAGHEIVVYTPFPMVKPPPNYTEVILDSIDTDPKTLNERVAELIKLPCWKCLDNLLPLHEEIMHPFLGNDNIQKLLQSKEKFDLLITETFCAQEFTIIFGHIFNVPTIGIQTFTTTIIPNLQLGNTLSMTYMPDGCSPYSNKMSFVERFVNSFALIRGMYMYYNDYIPTLEKKISKYIPNLPPILDLTKNMSLMFINDHLTANYPHPRPPNMIPIAGIHIAAEKPLPQEFKTFMDEAQHGVIVFSLGTLVPDEERPMEYFVMLSKVFKKLQQRVIWKTRRENIGEIPANVKVVKWMPQRDILAHPNCVLFITHGGLASQHETIYNGVPVVGIPFFADQHRNVGFYQSQEIGIRILPDLLTEESLTIAIHTVLGDPKYKDNMKRLSRIFKDQPLSPAQSVVFWTEYVLRHHGAGHLKLASTHMSWYQLVLIDVIAAIILVFISVAAAMFFILKKILYTIKGTKNTVPTFKRKVQ